MYASISKSIQLNVQWHNFNENAIFRHESTWTDFKSIFKRYWASLSIEHLSLSGIISNTFSFEYRSVDEFLPKSVLDGAQSILTLVGSIVITATVNPYFLIPACVMGVAFMYIRKIYLKTSKNIKRIEGVGM